MADTFTKTLGLNVTGSVDPQLAATIKRLHDLAFRNQKQVLKMMERVEKIQQRQKQHIDAINKKNNQRVAGEKKVAGQLDKQVQSYKKLAAEVRKSRQEASRKKGGVRGAQVGGLFGQAELGGKIGAGVGAFMGHPAVMAATFIAAKVGEIGAKLKNSVLIGAFLFLRVSRSLMRLWGSIVGMIAAAGKQMLAFSGSLLATSASLEGLQSRLGGIFGEKAGAIFDFITEKARTVPFEIDEMMTAFIRLQASGATRLVPIQRAFEAASDLAVTFNRTIEDTTIALTNLMAGRADRFIRGFNIRPDQLVPYGAKVRPGTGGLEAATDEDRKANLLAAIKFVEEKFGSMTESMANNFDQLMTSMKDLWKEFAGDLLIAGLPKVASSFFATIMKAKDALESGGLLTEWAESITGSAEKLVEVLVALLEFSPETITSALTTMASLVDKAIGMFNEFGGAEGFANRAAALIEFGDKIADAIKEVLPLILEVLPGLIRVFAGLTAVVSHIWSLVIQALGMFTSEPGSGKNKGGLMGAATGFVTGVSPLGSVAGAIGGYIGGSGAQAVRNESGLTGGQFKQTGVGVKDIGVELAKVTRELGDLFEKIDSGAGSVGKMDGLTDFQRQWLAANRGQSSAAGGGDQFFAGTAGGMGAVPGRSLAGGIGGVAGGVDADGPSAYGSEIRSASADGAAMMGSAITNALGGVGKAASTTSAAGSKGRSLSEFVSNVETVMSAMPVETGMSKKGGGNLLQRGAAFANRLGEASTDAGFGPAARVNDMRQIFGGPSEGTGNVRIPSVFEDARALLTGRSMNQSAEKLMQETAVLHDQAAVRNQYGDPDTFRFGETPSGPVITGGRGRKRSDVPSGPTIINIEANGYADLGLSMARVKVAVDEMGNHAK